MPGQRTRRASATAALFVCAASSVTAFTVTPQLRAARHTSRLSAAQRTGRQLEIGPSMIFTPPRIDENDMMTVESLKRSLNRLVDMPSAQPDDQVVREISPAPLRPRPHPITVGGTTAPQAACPPHTHTPHAQSPAALCVDTHQRSADSARVRL